MKKTISLFCLSIFANSYVSGQQFYFPNILYSDSVALAKAMPGLAMQLIENYKEPNKENYYNNLFRFQIVAEQYDGALTSIRKVRATSKDSLMATGIDFQFESYTIAKKTQIKISDPFEVVYPKIFNNLYHIFLTEGRPVLNIISSQI
jgi:hypothetical protein